MLATQSCQQATLQKLQRDVARVKQSARFVIVLEKGIPRLIDNKALFRKKQPFARLIAVVGPMRPVGKHTREPIETVLLEIGYSRTRPYAQVEYHLSEANGERSRNDRWHLAMRTRARNISDSELQS
ncbi:MAG: hypothetical protein E6P95_02555, partial [Candidatus Moraniibacteriota bacterium]